MLTDYFNRNILAFVMEKRTRTTKKIPMKAVCTSLKPATITTIERKADREGTTIALVLRQLIERALESERAA